MMQQSSASRKTIASFVFLEVLILLFSWWIEDTNLVALQTATRFSGRLSLFVFSAILIFYTKPEVLTRLFSGRHYFLFAVVHGIHLIELLIYVNLSGTHLIPYRVAGGFVAYLFIFIMPWLEQRNDQRRISPRSFAITENVYLIYVWFIFFMAYLPRVLGKLPNAGGSLPEHLTLFAWVLIVLILHLVMRFRKHNAVNA